MTGITCPIPLYNEVNWNSTNKEMKGLFIQSEQPVATDTSVEDLHGTAFDR